MKRAAKVHILLDLCAVLLSLVLAIALVRSDVFVQVLTATQEAELLGSLIAGLLFSSMFTTVPAVVTLGEIGQVQSIWLTAGVGAFGAMLGDLLIFQFIKGRVREDMWQMAGKRLRARVKKSSRVGRLFGRVLGGLIIASPLPDELGIGLLGITNMRKALFIPLVYALNFVGIVLICLIGRAAV